MRECLDEGTIQAYVDGELSSSAAEKIMMHAGACAACAAAIAEAESELSLLAIAFEPEMNVPVPSERLRERLDAAIGELRLQANEPARASWSITGWLASLSSSFNFAPRYAMGFASLVAVVAFAAIFAVVALRQNNNQSTLALVADKRATNLQSGIQLTSSETEPTPSGDTTFVKAGDPRVSNKSRRAPVSTPGKSKVNDSATPLVAESKPLPGEVGYLKTIASLTSVIEANGESALRPSLRADYERNLALVDNAIDATRKTARRNPNNQDAAEFLFSSYQSKIDLLSTIAEQGQMVAIAR